MRTLYNFSSIKVSNYSIHLFIIEQEALIYLKKDFINVNKFNAEANLPKKITSFSVIDKQMQPSFLEAVGCVRYKLLPTP